MDEKFISECNEDVGEEYLRIVTKNQPHGSISHKMLSIKTLTDFLASGKIRRKIVLLVKYPLCGETGEFKDKTL
jgi:hypothetical protein